MFGELNGDLADLEPDLRRKLAQFLERRNTYLTQTQELNRRKVALLVNPTPATRRDLEDYISAVIAPARERLYEDTIELFKEAVDVQKLKEMLPMALMALSEAVNFPILLTLLGADPEDIEKLVGKLRDYFSRGM